MLNPSDVYVSGGTSELRVCWTDKVTKYDASSFYNWEQDNLPLHDLDERTEVLWERLGGPTSAITGMSFIVSAGADEGCYPEYFATLSSCMEALPEVINYPILVEVVSFGDLGSLEIPSKIFGPRGSLEIINRNCSFGGAMALSGGSTGAMSMQQYNSDYTDYNIASAIVPAGNTITQLEAGASAPSLAFDMFNAETYNDGVRVASGSYYDDVRYGTDTGKYVFSRKVGPENNRLTAALSSTLQPWVTTGVDDASAFKFDAFDAPSARRTTEMNTYDVSTLNFLTNTEVQWGDGTTGDTYNYAAAAFAYANHLSNIKVENCNGPIYIRNFTVDAQHDRDKGIEILNSEVYLERCSVSRANKAGLFVDNSNVSLLRGFVAYRNYELDGTTRTGVPFADKRLHYKTQDSFGAGIHAVNSTIDIHSTYQRDIDKSTEASGNSYTDYTGDVPAPSMEALYCLSRNDIGIHAVNSQIIGGRTELNGSSTPAWINATQLFMELNTDAGVKLEQSRFENNGRVLLYGNYRGLDSSDSKFATDVLKCQHNQAEALLLNNSTFIYGKEPYATHTYSTQFNEYRFDQVTLMDNGTHMKAVNSVVAPGEASAVPSVFSQFYTASAFGINNAPSATDGLNGLLPSIDISNNSDVELVHFVGRRLDDTSVVVGYDRPVYGSIVKADKNSSIVMRGSKKFANVLVGAEGRENHIHHAGVFCNQNSTVSFQGPTVIASLGVDVLADNNSKMEFVPHRNNDGELLVETYNLSDALNHTTVELHSTRACLVSKGNSEISIQDLGDYRGRFGGETWGAGLISSVTFDYLDDVDGKQNDAQYRTNVSGGYIQFYPNAFVNDALITDVANGTDINASTTIFDAAAFTTATPNVISGVGNYYLMDLVAGQTSSKIAQISTGGMCVRALEGSKVNVTNVHFPAGWYNTSGIVYDLSGDVPNCSRLFMWNIADDSVLNANYVSVSGVHPRDAGYHGPSGDWGGSEALSNTPDSGAKSVLDYYGPSPLLSGTLGKSTHENYGPFRLFFSTDPACNWLMPSAQDTSGYIPQLFAQGYQFSANAIAGNSSEFNASSEYISLLRFEDQVNASGDIVPSGYYYASEMVYNPHTVKAVLDESASNLFANAKHNSVGKSNLAKVVSIYYPYVEYPVGGDSYSETDVGTTLGLASVNNFDLEKNN